jgi:hypothetical protein
MSRASRIAAISANLSLNLSPQPNNDDKAIVLTIKMTNEVVATVAQTIVFYRLRCPPNRQIKKGWPTQDSEFRLRFGTGIVGGLRSPILMHHAVLIQIKRPAAGASERFGHGIDDIPACG